MTIFLLINRFCFKAPSVQPEEQVEETTKSPDKKIVPKLDISKIKKRNDDQIEIGPVKIGEHNEGEEEEDNEKTHGIDDQLNSAKNIMTARTDAIESERVINTNMLTGVSPIINQKNASKVPLNATFKDEETADEMARN